MPLGRFTALLTAEAPTVSRLMVALKLSSADKSSVAWLPPTLPLPIQTWRLALVLLTLNVAPEPDTDTDPCCAEAPESSAPTVRVLVMLRVRPLAR